MASSDWAPDLNPSSRLNDSVTEFQSMIMGSSLRAVSSIPTSDLEKDFLVTH